MSALAIDHLADAMDESFAELSFLWSEELDAAVSEAALHEAADVAAATAFCDLARSMGCGLFADALAACGLATELPALSSSSSSASPGASHIVVVAPSDQALRAIADSSLRRDANAMRALCMAHIIVDDATAAGIVPGGGACALRSLQGTVHSFEAAVAASTIPIPIHDATTIGSARVIGAAPFMHGVLIAVDAVLPALRVEQETRAHS